MISFKFICVLYQFHRWTPPIMKIQFRGYVLTGMEPKVGQLWCHVGFSDGTAHIIKGKANAVPCRILRWYTHTTKGSATVLPYRILQWYPHTTMSKTAVVPRRILRLYTTPPKVRQLLHPVGFYGGTPTPLWVRQR